MRGFRLTKRAKADIKEIGAHTRDRWGAAQAVRYLAGLDACLERLAKPPFLGRACDAIQAGYFRDECVSHVVFFKRPQSGVVLVVRILHERMVPTLHMREDDNE